MQDKSMKTTLYFPNDINKELRATAKRLGRSPAWLLRHAWMLAKSRIQQTPAPLARLPASDAPTGVVVPCSCGSGWDEFDCGCSNA